MWRVPISSRSLVVAVLGVGLAAAPIPAPHAAGAQAVEPVEGTIVDTFRPPVHIGAPGNRGWEYSVPPGTPVRAVRPGVVAFAGRIGPNLYVSIDHGDGLRTTYSLLGSINVIVGDQLLGGEQLGTSAQVFHFGARRHGVYVDPAGLFGGGPPRAWLVARFDPVWFGASSGHSLTPTGDERPWAVSVRGAWEYTHRLARHWAHE